MTIYKLPTISPTPYRGKYPFNKRQSSAGAAQSVELMNGARYWSMDENIIEMDGELIASRAIAMSEVQYKAIGAATRATFGSKDRAATRATLKAALNIDLESGEYLGVNFTIGSDQCADNPFTDWDCQPPLMVRANRHIVTYGTLPDFGDCITDGQLARHWHKLCTIFDGLADDYDYHRKVLEYSASEAKRETLERALAELSGGDKLDALEQAFRLIGYPALSTSAQGYSQGDYVELLIVYTPDWCKLVGIKWPRNAAQRAILEQGMESTRAVYAAWAFGDVYYASSGDDSCGGFYGSDHDKSGLVEWLIDTITAKLGDFDHVIDATLRHFLTGLNDNVQHALNVTESALTVLRNDPTNKITTVAFKSASYVDAYTSGDDVKEARKTLREYWSK